MSSSGSYRIAVMDSEGNIKQESVSSNLITTAGLAMFFNGVNLHTDCKLGTGLTAPQVTDSGVETPISEVCTFVGFTENTPNTYTFEHAVTFSFTMTTSHTLTEVGVYDNHNVLFSRSLLQTPLVVVMDEIVQVTYTVSIILPATISSPQQIALQLYPLGGPTSAGDTFFDYTVETTNISYIDRLFLEGSGLTQMLQYPYVNARYSNGNPQVTYGSVALFAPGVVDIEVQVLDQTGLQADTTLGSIGVGPFNVVFTPYIDYFRHGQLIVYIRFMWA